MFTMKKPRTDWHTTLLLLAVTIAICFGIYVTMTIAEQVEPLSNTAQIDCPYGNAFFIGRGADGVVTVRCEVK